jgi:hypothetical protein
MSVAEMKLAAIAEISKLHTEAALKEILEHLEKISVTEKKPLMLKLSLMKHRLNMVMF